MPGLIRKGGGKKNKDQNAASAGQVRCSKCGKATNPRPEGSPTCGECSPGGGAVGDKSVYGLGLPAMGRKS